MSREHSVDRNGVTSFDCHNTAINKNGSKGNDGVLVDRFVNRNNGRFQLGRRQLAYYSQQLVRAVGMNPRKGFVGFAARTFSISPHHDGFGHQFVPSHIAAQ